VKSVLPQIKQPMLATLIDAPFDDDAWAFETKWDGVRALCYIEAGTLRMQSRTGRDLLVQFPEFGSLVRAFRGTPALLDGEIVSLDRKGRSSFQRLQSRLNRIAGAQSAGLAATTYVVFDALYAQGRDLRREPFEERKRVLKSLLKVPARNVRYSAHVVRSGKKAFARAARLGLEGIVGKRLASTYQERRSRDWVKIKRLNEQEVVIGGWTDPQGSRKDFGSLLVGVYERGKFVYVGRVGTGFDRALLSDVKRRLTPLEINKSPFAVPIPVKAHWVRPVFVCEVKFSEWTRDGVMRQPVFLGLRTDKRAKDVVRERPKL
jgi:bifunctional non-homologous end joining protein LigD